MHEFKSAHRNAQAHKNAYILTPHAHIHTQERKLCVNYARWQMIRETDRNDSSLI